MEKNDSLDVESLRNPFESNTEWQMRRSFLEVHADKFPLDRLICLSNCYVNVEMYGCRYPELVMKQLRELEKDILEYVSLKKESSSAEVEIKGGETMLINDKFQELSRMIIQYRLQKVQNKTTTSVELLYMVGSKCQMIVSNKIEPATLENGGAGFACELFIDRVSVITGRGSKKKTAKEDACGKAIDVLSRSSLSVVENESGNLKLIYADMDSIPASSPDFVSARPIAKPQIKSQNQIKSKSNSSVISFSVPSLTTKTRPQLMGICQQMGIMQRTAPCQQQKRKRDYEETCSDTSQFILIYREEDPILSSLKRIADFNKVELNYKSEATGSGWRCETYFGKLLIADGIGIDEKEARINSAEKALTALKETCWSLKEKQSADTDETAMTKDDLLADLKVGGEALPDSNIGNMLLRKMGWTGGGVGKEGNKGIAEPVHVGQVVNRQGLGLMSAQGTPDDFYNKMNKFVSDYLQSDNQSEVVFSPEFTKEERAVIHQVCTKFNLKASSRGSGDDRYLTMGRKRNAIQLLDYVMSKGGSTHKYEMIPPSGLPLSGELDSHN